MCMSFVVVYSDVIIICGIYDVTQIMDNLQNLSVTKILFKPAERAGATSNGRNSDHTSLVPILERVANGYYKTVVSAILLLW